MVVESLPYPWILGKEISGWQRWNSFIFCFCFFCVLASLSCLCLLCLLLLLLLHMTHGSWDLKQTELMGIRFPVCLNGPQQLLQFSIIFLQNISIKQTVWSLKFQEGWKKTDPFKMTVFQVHNLCSFLGGAVGRSMSSQCVVLYIVHLIHTLPNRSWSSGSFIHRECGWNGESFSKHA